MFEKQQLNELLDLIDEAGIGVLATIGTDGRPRQRWMTVAAEPSRPGSLFCVAYRNSAKIEQMNANPQVQWVFRTDAGTATVDGNIAVIDNPTVTAGVLELLGGRLQRFWEQDINPEDVVVLETAIESIELQ